MDDTASRGEAAHASSWTENLRVAQQDEEAAWGGLSSARGQLVDAAMASGMSASMARKHAALIEGKRRLDPREPATARAMEALTAAAGPETVGAWVSASRAFRDASDRAFHAAMEVQDRDGAAARAAVELEGPMGAMRAAIIAEAARINPTLDIKFARELWGEGHALVASGADGTDRIAVAGMYEHYHNLASISLDPRYDTLANGMHEIWHSLEHTLTPQEQRALRQAFPATDRLSHEEAVAYAFGEWAAGRIRQDDPEARRAFRKMALLTGRAGQAFAATGLGEAGKVFERAFGGELGQRAVQMAARAGRVSPVNGPREAAFAVSEPDAETAPAERAFIIVDRATDRAVFGRDDAASAEDVVASYLADKTFDRSDLAEVVVDDLRVYEVPPAEYVALASLGDRFPAERFEPLEINVWRVGVLIDQAQPVPLERQTTIALIESVARMADAWERTRAGGLDADDLDHLDIVAKDARATLGMAYEDLIGYDPFSDDPRITPAEVGAILAEYLSDPDVLAPPPRHSEAAYSVDQAANRYHYAAHNSYADLENGNAGFQNSWAISRFATAAERDAFVEDKANQLARAVTRREAEAIWRRREAEAIWRHNYESVGAPVPAVGLHGDNGLLGHFWNENPYLQGADQRPIAYSVGRAADPASPIHVLVPTAGASGLAVDWQQYWQAEIQGPEAFLAHFANRAGIHALPAEKLANAFAIYAVPGAVWAKLPGTQAFEDIVGSRTPETEALKATLKTLEPVRIDLGLLEAEMQPIRERRAAWEASQGPETASKGAPGALATGETLKTTAYAAAAAARVTAPSLSQEPALPNPAAPSLRSVDPTPLRLPPGTHDLAFWKALQAERALFAMTPQDLAATARLTAEAARAEDDAGKRAELQTGLSLIAKVHETRGLTMPPEAVIVTTPAPAPAQTRRHRGGAERD